MLFYLQPKLQERYFTTPLSSMQYPYLPCNTPIFHAIPYLPCNTLSSMQYPIFHAIPLSSMQYPYLPCNTPVFHATPLSSMQYPYLPCNTPIFHVTPLPSTKAARKIIYNTPIFHAIPYLLSSAIFRSPSARHWWQHQFHDSLIWTVARGAGSTVAAAPCPDHTRAAGAVGTLVKLHDSRLLQ